jgi:hypothetical protein
MADRGDGSVRKEREEQPSRVAVRASKGNLDDRRSATRSSGAANKKGTAL